MEEGLLNEHKIKMLVIFCLWRLAADIIYVFGYEFLIGVSIPEPVINVERYWLSWAIFFMLMLCYVFFIFDKDRLKDHFSQQMYLLLFLLSVTPFFSIYSVGGISSTCCLYYNIFFYVLLIVQVIVDYFFSFRKKILFVEGISKYNLSKFRNKLFVIIYAISVLSILVTFFYYLDGKAYIDGINVYGQRELFSLKQKEMPRLLVYFLGCVNVVETIFMMYCLRLKKYFWFVIAIFLAYIHFLIAGEKTVLFSVIFAVFLYCLASGITMFRVVIFTIGLAVGCLLAAFSEKIYTMVGYEHSTVANILSGLCVSLSFFRRVIFTPAHLQEIWVNFFGDHNPSYWGINSDYSVGQGIENYISDVYLDSPLGHANTGLLGDCFANMGEYGVFVYPIIIVVILWCFDFVLKGKNAMIFIGVALMFVISLMNSMLTTVMISHGGLVMLLMLWCFPDDAMDRKEIGNNGSV